MSNGRSFKRKINRPARVKDIEPDEPEFSNSQILRALKIVAQGDPEIVAAVKAELAKRPVSVAPTQDEVDHDQATMAAAFQRYVEDEAFRQSFHELMGVMEPLAAKAETA